MKIDLTGIDLGQTTDHNQVCSMAWKITGDPDSSYIALPNATVSPAGLIISPDPYTFNTGSNDGVTVRATNQCNNTYIVYKVFEGLVTYWIEKDYICEQDGVFTEVARVETLSSPRYSFYFKPTIGFERLYVMDQDDVNGVFWWVDPVNFSFAAERTYITGSDVLTECYAAASDRQYNRLYATGLFTTGGGLLVYDIENDDLTTIPYGSNGSGSFSRTSITVEGNFIYCGDRTNNTITIINRNDLTVNSTIALSTVPADGSGRKITAGCALHFINGEIWVWNVGDPGSNNVILRYNTTLTVLNGVIDTSAYRALWQVGVVGSEGYWGRSFFDAEKERFYVSDIGSSNIVVVDTSTNTIVQNTTITNREGYTCATSSFVSDPITADLFIVVQPIGNSGAGGNNRTYRVNRDELEFLQVYPNLGFQQLERVGTTNVLWGMFPGQTKWSGGSWNTDGIAIKFEK